MYSSMFDITQEVSSDYSDPRARDVCDAADGSQVRMTALFVTTPHFMRSILQKATSTLPYPRSQAFPTACVYIIIISDTIFLL